jgi:hypothetical protein
MTGHSWDDVLMWWLLRLVIGAGLFLLLRVVFLWYWRVNESLKKLGEIAETLKRIENKAR